jgi:hypothetical protein
MGKANRVTKNKPSGTFRLFSQPPREIACRACGRPYLVNPLPQPSQRFCVGNSEVQLFESKPFGALRRDFEVSCWRYYANAWHASKLFNEHDFKCLALVIDAAMQVIKKPPQTQKPVVGKERL